MNADPSRVAERREVREARWARIEAAIGVSAAHNRALAHAAQEMKAQRARAEAASIRARLRNFFSRIFAH